MKQVKRAYIQTLNGTWSDDKPTSPAPSTYEGLPPVIDDFSCADWTIYLKRNRLLLGLDRTREIMLKDFSNQTLNTKIL